MVRGVDTKTSSDQFIKIIRNVEKRPMLYHKSLSEHGHEARMQIWEEVGKEVNLPAITCKERWRYARSVFVRHSRNENVGKAGDNLVKHLHFLKKHISLKKEPLPEKLKHTKYKNTSNLSSSGHVKQVNRDRMKFKKPFKQKPRIFSKNLNSRTSTNDSMDEGYVDTFTKLQNMRKRSKKICSNTDSCNKLQDIKVEYDSDSDVMDHDLVLDFVYDKRQKCIREFSSEDADLHFLRSLLLEMNLMNSKQKGEFKLKMIALAADVLNM